MKTRTGGFPLGFRRGGGEWQKDLGKLIAWAKENGLEAIDLGRDADQAVKEVRGSGLRIGSVDLSDWGKGMISSDKGKRAEAVAQNKEYIATCAAGGPLNFFLVMLPENPALTRLENFGYMVESFAQLAPVLEQTKSHLAIEGWPGPGALCCTPEGYRAFFKEVPSKAMGINYDPSHLVRQGIDCLRFLREFGDRVYHIHGKDVEWLEENHYEYGRELPAIFAKNVPYGALAWRYTVPGFGVVRWIEVMKLLVDKGYKGCICIELEDASFYREEQAEKLGIVQGAKFLVGC
jgi:sugar phosphate isomerase/epimerase